MKPPIIFLPDVVFPGLPGQLEVPRETGLALRRFHDYMGFGTLDVALVFPKDDGAPPGPGNHIQAAAVAEIIVEDIPEDGPALLLVHSGHRVKLGDIGTMPAGHGSGWTGPGRTVASGAVSRPDPTRGAAAGVSSPVSKACGGITS